MKNHLPLLLLFLLPISIGAQTSYSITSTDGTTLYVEEKGEGQAILLFSGGPGINPQYLYPLYDELSKDYRVIFMHQRGTGMSHISVVDSTSMSMENYVNDIEALREHLQLKKITLMGHSWGGMLAMEYTSIHPKKVEKLILLNTGGPTLNFTNYFRDNMTMRLRPEDLDKTAELENEGKSSLEGIWPGYYFSREKALIARSNTDMGSIRGQTGVTGTTFRNYFNKDDQRIKQLKKYKGPVYIVSGRQDPIGESTMYEIKSLLPKANITFIEKCGHFAWDENEDQYKEYLTAIYKALE